MQSSNDILSEMKSARREGDRERFHTLIFNLVQLHRSWLEYRYGNFDEQVEDSLAHAFMEALQHADFDSIMHPDAYFKTVAINHLRSERRKARRKESLDELEQVGVLPEDQAIDPREALAVEEYHRLLIELDLAALMEQARRSLEEKAPLQAYLLTVRAADNSLSYADIAGELGMDTDAKTQTYLRVQHLRGREAYSRFFMQNFKKAVGDKQQQYEEALMHYFSHTELYPPIPGISDSAANALGEIENDG